MSGEKCRCRRCRNFRRCRCCAFVRLNFVCQYCLTADVRNSIFRHQELERALALGRERILSLLLPAQTQSVSSRILIARRQIELLRAQRDRLELQIKNDQLRVAVMRQRIAEQAARDSAESFKEATDRRHRRITAAWAAEKASICERREQTDLQILEARRALVAELLVCMRISATPIPYGSICGLPIILSPPESTRSSRPQYTQQSQEYQRRQTNAAIGYLAQAISLISLYLGAPIPLAIHFGSSESCLSFHRSCPPTTSQILSRSPNYMVRHNLEVASASATAAHYSGSARNSSNYPQWMSFVFEPLAATSSSESDIALASQLTPTLSISDMRHLISGNNSFNLLVDAPLRVPAKGTSVAPFVQAASMLAYSAICLCAAYRVSVPPERLLCFSSNILECYVKSRSCFPTRYVISYGAVRAACVDAILNDMGVNINDFQEPQTASVNIAKRNSDGAIDMQKGSDGSSHAVLRPLKRPYSPPRSRPRQNSTLAPSNSSNSSSASFTSSGSQSPPLRVTSSSTSLTEEDEWLLLPIKPSYSGQSSVAALPLLEFSFLNISGTSDIQEEGKDDNPPVTRRSLSTVSSNSSTAQNARRSRRDRHSLMISPLVDVDEPSPALRRSTSFSLTRDIRNENHGAATESSSESLRGMSFTSILHWGRRLIRDTLSPNAGNDTPSQSPESSTSGTGSGAGSRSSTSFSKSQNFQ